jgi:chitinase
MKLSRVRQFVVVVLCLAPLAFFATAKPAAAQSEVIAINAGGPAVSPFVADVDFSGGATINHANTINTSNVTNPAPAAVYQSARVTATVGAGTTFSYTIPGFTAGSMQTVRLHFAETFHTTAGSRVFNVSINGTQVLTNFDIFATAGGQNIANIQEFTEAANSSGQYVIVFTTVTDKALISGIEIDSTSAACSVAPTDPTGLTATTISNNEIDLSWTASTAPSGCTVHYAITRNNADAATALSGTTFKDTGLSCNTTETYQVFASDAAGSSNGSNTATATTLACAPNLAINSGGPAVAPFVADEDFTGGATINHANTINTSKVNFPAPQAVYQSARVTATAGAGTSFSYTVGGLTPGSFQNVRLHFAETFHTTAGSRVFNVSINGTQVLTNFDIFAAAGGENIAYIWESVMSPNSSGQYVIVFTTVVDKALISGIEINSTSPTSCSAVPAAPSGLTATAASSSVINLNWNAVAPPANCTISSYSVFGSTSSTFTPSSSTLLGSTSGTTFSDTGLAASTTYYYVVEANDTDGGSPASNETSAMTSSTSPPPSTFIFSPYKDITINANWNTGGQQTAVTGTVQPVTSVMPNQTLDWAFASGACGSETWAGITPAMEATNIQSYVSAGKLYIVSSGGAGGTFTCSSTSAFISFIQRYNSSNMLGVDFDIESGQSQAIVDAFINDVKAAEGQFPNMRFSFTIATLGGTSNPDLGSEGTLVVNEIKRLGLGGHYTVNLMAMDYGSTTSTNCVVVNGACEMGQSAITAAMALHSQFGIPYGNIEITVMIGQNDSGGEIFTLSDVDTLSSWVKSNGVVGVHFWSFDRDTPCPAGAASATCNSYPTAGSLAFNHRFMSDLGAK